MIPKNSINDTNLDPSVLETGLSDIKEQIVALNLAPSVYAGLKIQEGKLDIAVGGKEAAYSSPYNLLQDDSKDVIASCFASYAKQSGKKVIATGISGTDKQYELVSKLWFDQDIVSYFYVYKGSTPQNLGNLLARKVEGKFDGNNIVKPVFGDRNRVLTTDLASLKDYEQACSPEEFQMIKHLANKLQGKKILFISSTPQGGGVALMRHAILRLLKHLNVDATWHVMSNQSEIFDITKTKFHNILQAVANPDVVLTEEDEQLYGAWIKENAENFKDLFVENSVIIIDDPQPSGLIPYIKQLNSNAYVIYRSHIQIEAHLTQVPGSPQYRTWQYLWNNIKLADCFVAHPIKGFIPQEVEPSKTVLMPASTDPLDGLNKPLDDEQQTYYLKLFDKFLLENTQTPLDNNRPYIIQIARFDPSKGIPDVIEAFRKLRLKLAGSNLPLPQLVICGNGSVDDPDHRTVFNLTMEILNQPEYAEIKNDTKVVRLPHIDQMLNAILRKSMTCLQLSHKEGFEIKVTEALMKGVPVVAYNSGGIPLQIQDGVTGFLAETGNTDQVAEYLFQLYANPAMREQISKQAEQLARKDVLAVTNTINWLFLASELIEKGRVSGDGRDVSEIIKESVQV